MGVSWTSTANVCAYAAEEAPDISSVGFERVQVNVFVNHTEPHRTLSFPASLSPRLSCFGARCALYRSDLAPTNVTAEPYWDGFHCIWCVPYLLFLSFPLFFSESSFCVVRTHPTLPLPHCTAGKHKIPVLRSIVRALNIKS
ncbi:hypothetical protein K438DRAFT_313986 [Mycena galopus ATCC 62051]|nr:hypothetical protein K438DRAFT_313986 [Mycena galopus ATCC 62051]